MAFTAWPHPSDTGSPTLVLSVRAHTFNYFLQLARSKSVGKNGGIATGPKKLNQWVQALAQPIDLTTWRSIIGEKGAFVITHLGEACRL
jgi:hypothetical protein